MEKNVKTPPTPPRVYAREANQAKGSTVTADGIVVVSKSYRF